MWSDSRTKGVVTQFQQKLDEVGIEVQPGVFKRGKDSLSEMYILLVFVAYPEYLINYCSSGLPLSTYFSGIKLRWMLDHHPEVRKAHEADELMFGTVESWILYVSLFFSSMWRF